MWYSVALGFAFCGTFPACCILNAVSYKLQLYFFLSGNEYQRTPSVAGSGSMMYIFQDWLRWDAPVKQADSVSTWIKYTFCYDVFPIIARVERNRSLKRKQPLILYSLPIIFHLALCIWRHCIASFFLFLFFPKVTIVLFLLFWLPSFGMVSVNAENAECTCPLKTCASQEVPLRT